MKEDALQTISFINDRKKNEYSTSGDTTTTTSSTLCSWGLTPRTRLGSRLRRTRRVSAIKCVLEQQDDLYWMRDDCCMNGCDDANTSTKCTNAEVIIASVES